MKRSKQWFVLAYDIRDPKRLRRVHYFLKRHAIPLQKSVFLAHKKPSEIHFIFQELRKLTRKNEDDIRMYPVTSPYHIWAAGTQAKSLSGLYGKAPAKQVNQKRGFLKSLFDRVA